MNRFNDVNDVEELLAQMVGAGSMCWNAGVFDSNEALKIVNEGYSRLQEIK